MGRGGFVRVAGGGVAVFGGSGVSARAAYCSLLERKELRERERGESCCCRPLSKVSPLLHDKRAGGGPTVDDWQADMRT